MTSHWLDVPLAAPYRLTMLGAIAFSAWHWFARSKREPALLAVYVGALGGAFLGAKLAYLFAEGWRDWPLPDRWLRWFAGKSVIGGLLGGYGGVELMKAAVRHPGATGDRFVLVVPPAIALGRVGCWLQGCCLGRPAASAFLAVRDHEGVPRWPAAQVELVFQLAMFALLFSVRTDPRFRDRLFFLYLAAYGVFRFLHEYLRETPSLAAGLTGYQMLSLLAAGLGAWMFVRRGRQQMRPDPASP